MTYDEFRILNEKPLLSVEEAAELTGLGQHIIRAMERHEGSLWTSPYDAK